MKEIISQINQSIEEKRDRLKEKTERYFASITIPAGNTLQRSGVANKSKGVPPLSYILYGVAGISAIVAIASDSKDLYKALCLAITAASASGGYILSKQSRTAKDNDSSYLHNVNIESLKNEVTSKVLDSVKKITQEWERFMELKQQEIRSVIAKSSLTDSEKDLLSSKVFIYEVISIRISEFSSMVNMSATTTELTQKIATYKDKVIAAIDSAAVKQILKYNSLIS